MKASRSYNYEALALCISSEFEIEVREHEDDQGIYRLNLLHKSDSYFRVALEWTLPNLLVLKQMKQYLLPGIAGEKCKGHLILGQYFGNDLTLIQDDDWLQRYFIVAKLGVFPSIDSFKLTIAGETLGDFAGLLQKIIDEVEE